MALKNKGNKKNKKERQRPLETDLTSEIVSPIEALPESDRDSIPSPLPGAELITADTSGAAFGNGTVFFEPEGEEKQKTYDTKDESKASGREVTTPSSQTSSSRPPSYSNRLSQIFEWVSGKTAGKAQVSEFVDSTFDTSAKEGSEVPTPKVTPLNSAIVSTKVPEADVKPVLSQDKQGSAPPQYSDKSGSSQKSSSHQDEAAGSKSDFSPRENNVPVMKEISQPRSLIENDVASGSAVPEEQTSSQPSSTSLLKKHVHFTNKGSKADETTPLIQSRPNDSPASRTSYVTFSPPRSSASQRSNTPKPQIWMWFAVGGMLFLGNIALLIFLFTGQSKFDQALDDLLSQIDPKYLRRDLEALQGFKHVNKSSIEAYPSFPGELANAEYIENQLRMLPNFDIEIQHFLKPQWTLDALPSLTLYFDWQVPLEYQRDFIVLPYSGGASGIHSLITRNTVPDSCSLYSQRFKERALLVPYPSYEKYGINKPCPVWDLAYSAQEAGATAVIFYLEDYDSKFPSFDDAQHPVLLPQGWQPGASTLQIPVLLLSRRCGDLLQKEPLGLMKMDILVSFLTRPSMNLIAKQSHQILNQHPIIIGAFWDSDPLSHYPKHYKASGAAGLLAAARALSASGFRIKSHPIHIVWFGFRSPLQLGLMKYLGSLEDSRDSIQWPYFYLDLGRLEGVKPILFDTNCIPSPLQAAANTAQNSMENSIKYEVDRDRIPLYGFNGSLGAPEEAFIKYEIPTAGLSSLRLSNSTSLHAEMVFQLTEVALIAVNAIAK